MELLYSLCRQESTVSSQNLKNYTMKRENLVLYSHYFNHLIHVILNPVAKFFKALLVVSM